MYKTQLLNLIDLCEEQSVVIGELIEGHELLKEFTKEETWKRFSLETLLLDKGILTREELDERYNVIKDSIEDDGVE